MTGQANAVWCSSLLLRSSWWIRFQREWNTDGEEKNLMPYRRSQTGTSVLGKPGDCWTYEFPLNLREKLSLSGRDYDDPNGGISSSATSQRYGRRRDWRGDMTDGATQIHDGATRRHDGATRWRDGATDGWTDEWTPRWIASGFPDGSRVDLQMDPLMDLHMDIWIRF